MGKRTPLGHEAVKIKEAVSFYTNRINAYRVTIKALEKLIAEDERQIVAKHERLGVLKAAIRNTVTE